MAWPLTGRQAEGVCPLCVFQMVVVSDDVHEYAVALKDTEEKIARCPPRVSHSLPSPLYSLCVRLWS